MTRETLEQLAVSSLDEIVERCDAKLSVERRAWKTDLVLSCAPVFFQVELDWRETAVFALVGLLRQGAVPSGYYVDDEGNHVRWLLARVLSKSDVPELQLAAKKLKSTQAASGEEAMRQQLTLVLGIISRVADQHLTQVVTAIQHVSGSASV